MMPVVLPVCRCGEDERLVGLFRRKGLPANEPRAAQPPGDATSANPGSNNRRLSSSLPKPTLEPRTNRRSSSGTSPPSRLGSATSGSSGTGLVGTRQENGKENSDGGGGDGRPDTSGDRAGVNRDKGEASRDRGGDGSVVGKGTTDRGAANSKGKAGGGRGEEMSFFELVGSWSPPWSITRVNVQEPQQPAGGKDHEQDVTTQKQHQQQKQKQQQQQAEDADTKKRGKDSVEEAEEGVISEEGVEGAGSEDGEPQLCVLDARTAVAALGNQLVGKGVETGNG